MDEFIHSQKGMGHVDQPAVNLELGGTMAMTRYRCALLVVRTLQPITVQ